MKTTYGWDNQFVEEINGTNSSGFSGLPGGFRDWQGGWNFNAGRYGYWWSSSPSGSDAWHRELIYSSNGFGRTPNNPRKGFSVRCLRDAE